MEWQKLGQYAQITFQSRGVKHTARGPKSARCEVESSHGMIL